MIPAMLCPLLATLNIRVPSPTFTQVANERMGTIGVVAFLLGLIVGSFLNVCIHRIPLGMSVNHPRHSFCPACNACIPWYCNVPVFSWLVLRGKCVKCHRPISARYPLVELITGISFLGVWMRFHTRPELVVPYWALAALLVVATFIDLDHLYIPDRITIGGAILGCLACLAVPALVGQSSRWQALLSSALSALAGFALLYAFAQLGKLAFGRRNQRFDPPVGFGWKQRSDGGEADLNIGDELTLWSEYFTRESDVMNLSCANLLLTTREHDHITVAKPVLVRCYYNRLLFIDPKPGGLDQTYRLEDLESFGGTLRGFGFPREAMGMGDMKLMLLIGAFLGWQSLPFVLGSSVVLAAVMLPFLRRDSGNRIPFGPSLAAGTLLWLFAGPQLVQWYTQRFL